METPKTILFFGKPGCGKGTQAKKLQSTTGWPMAGSGERLRAISAEDTYVAKKIKEEIDQGVLSPPWLIQYLYLDVLNSVPLDQTIILDGFNRKPEEARLIYESAEFFNRSFVVLNISVSDEEVRRRLQGRQKHSGRMDDQAIDVRLREYSTYTKPTLDMYKAMDRCIDINGEQSPEHVARDVLLALRLSIA